MSEHHLQLCPTCQRNMSLSYYCESCHSSFCSDCIKEKTTEKIICGNCGSDDLKRNKDGNLTCGNCLSQNISKIYKDVIICPKCHSSKIVKVFEKKKEINNNFLQSIKNTREFLAPFRFILDKLSLLRSKLKKAREPPVKCFHFPSLEAELITIYKVFSHVKRESFENIKRIFNHIFVNKNYFVDIFSQSHDNISVIEGILANLNYEQQTLADFIETNLKRINDSMQEIENKLDFIEEIQNRFQKFCNIIDFTRNEKALYALKCKMSKGYNLKTELSNKRGSLLISNFNIYFVHEYGVIRKKANLLFKITHDEFKRIKIIGTLRKRLYMEFVYGRYYFAVNSAKRNNVIDYIENARIFDENHIYDLESANELIAIKLTLKDLHDFIEQNISFLLSLICNQNNFYQPLPYNSINQSEYNLNHGQNYRFANPNPNYATGYHRAPVNGMDHIQNDLYFNENNYISKKLRETQVHQSQYPPPTNTSPPYRQDVCFPQFIQVQNNPYNQRYPNTNSFFDQNSPMQQSNTGNEYQFDNSQPSLIHQTKNKKTQLLELQKEEYSLQQTIKVLDRRFEEGSISDVDYLKTYRRYQRDLYIIQRKIEDLKKDIEEEDEIQNISTLF